MTITEFAKSRKQQAQTISRYLSRHELEFKGHTKKVGKSVVLDEDAVALLDEVYPLPRPVQIVEGVPQEEFDKLRDKYESLLEFVREVEGKKADIELQQVKLEAESNAMSLLLEDKKNQLEKAEKRIEEERELSDQLRAELKSYKKTIFGLYKKE